MRWHGDFDTETAVIFCTIVPQPQRLDIQGLRALAVALVVIFHLIPAALPGGYIGVDVFFVISGFLITAHLLREVNQTGTVKLSEFWARRMRRLLPAASLVLIVSAVAALLVLPQSTLPQSLSEIFFAAIYVVNWNFAANSVDYLGADISTSIAQHYWSLSVEEQFYIVWPVLILAGAWLAKRVLKLRARPVIIGILAIVFVASLAFSIVETARSQPSAYFITTTRAWEFAAGGLVSVLPLAKMSARLRVGFSWVAVGAIAGSAFIFDAATAFPGWVALLPVGATAFLLYAGDLSSTNSPQYLARAGWIQAIGSLSYSIYLWHWPLIVVVASLQGRPPGWKTMIALAALTVILAALTKRFVEDPIRTGPGMLNRRVPTFTAMAASTAVIAAVTLVPIAVTEVALRDRIERVEALVADESSCFGAYSVLNSCAHNQVADGLVDPAFAMQDTYNEDMLASGCEHSQPEGQSLRRCSYPGDESTIVLYGDSHAAHITAPVRTIAQERGDSLEVLSRTGCPGFPAPGTSEGCEKWSTAAIDDMVNDENVTTVIISVRSVLSFKGSTEVAHAQMERLIEAGKDVYVFRVVPGTPTEWPASWRTRAEFAPTCVELENECDWTPDAYDDWLIEAAERANATVLNSWEMVCPDGVCRSVIGGTIVYFDDSHLTLTFAKTMTPWLRERIA